MRMMTALLLLSLGACAYDRPNTISSPRLDSGVRGSGGDGIGGEAVVDKPEGNVGTINRVRVR